MRTFDFDTEFETETGTIFVHASGTISTYHPATMYRSNGDPGDPAEGGEIEYDELTATDENQQEVDFPDGLFDSLDQEAICNASDDSDRY